MEFTKQYLTYEEYQELGGTLEETPFDMLELEAQKNIDKYTFGRLKNLDEQINEVKICEYKLIELLETYNSYNTQNKSVSSENTDGYSVSYSGANENVLKAKEEYEQTPLEELQEYLPQMEPRYIVYSI
mgnify:CR=1 FL=1